MYCNVQLSFMILYIMLVLENNIGDMILIPGALFWDLLSVIITCITLIKYIY